MNYQACEINSREEFLKIRDEWNRLLSSSEDNHPFLRHEWLTIWWDHFGSENTMVVILVRDGDSLVVAMPLMELGRSIGNFGFTILQSWTNFHSNRHGILLRHGHEGALDSVLNYLEGRPRRWDLLLLQELHGDSETVGNLLREVSNFGLTSEIWERGYSPYIPIDRAWDEYYQSLKAKFRSNLRNREKRLAKLGHFVHEVFVAPDDIDSVLAKGFEIENKSWKGANESAIACDPVLVSFYSEIAKLAAREKWLRLSFLTDGENRVAFDYSLVYKHTLYCLKIGFDPEYQPYSVGQQLCKANVERSFEDGLCAYDFLGESSTQKRDWTSRAQRITWLYIYNRTLAGRLHHLYKFRLKKSLKRLSSRK